MMGIRFKLYHWWCPQCGKTKRTFRNKAPLCKGSSDPQSGWWHLYAYFMVPKSE